MKGKGERDVSDVDAAGAGLLGPGGPAGDCEHWRGWVTRGLGAGANLVQPGAIQPSGGLCGFYTLFAAVPWGFCARDGVTGDGTHWNGVCSTGRLTKGSDWIAGYLLADKRQTWEKQNKPKTRQSSKKFQATIFEQASSKRLGRQTKKTKQTIHEADEASERVGRTATAKAHSRVERTAFHLPVETTES
ncbi:hypothetical protein E4U35_008227 [Claviceps purpurea]|nr:hypothetical protein E4U37_006846 [Claviceps purpurea]KAG6188898.1 hypothetical protein E4U36_006174 [Claviceps purpurea]KAG6208613.1 hypothetical protein E4U35_008227 [Claviceps purpurea]KAG6304710.1 hypothetical protein E4U45_001270 [Claviceps purpurea]